MRMGRKEKKLTKFRIVILAMLGVTLLLNLAACVEGLCNVYKAHCYPVIATALGKAMGWFPVALGELLMYLAAILLLVTLLILGLFPVLRGRKGYRSFAAGYLKTMLGITVTVLFLYTLNWVIPFRSALLEIPGAVERSYSLAEVRNVRNYLVEQLNSCALQVDRDESGQIIYPENMAESVYTSMRELGEVYPLLRGYYPPMKEALCSDVLDWMSIGGYTYPYTMEVTYNKYVIDLFYPSLLAHEMAHHKGYYQENEANFISFLACTQSKDPLVRYSGFRDIYYYMEDAYCSTLNALMSPQEAWAEFSAQPQVLDLVHWDETHAREISQEKYREDSHPVQSLETVANEVADVGWSVQGDLLRENCYDGVVKMVLQYYDAGISQTHYSKACEVPGD